MTVGVRPAQPDDVAAIHALVVELAVYERAPDAVEADADSLRRALFGPAPAVFAHVVTGPQAQVVGVAVWCVTYSTWLGRHGMHLEDLVVTATARGAGHGRALLEALAAVCVERDYRRLDWMVLDWNEPAAGFYRSIGAAPLDQWHQWRLTGAALTSFAARPTPGRGS